MGSRLSQPTDGAVIVPVLIPFGDTEHGYGHLPRSTGVGGQAAAVAP